MQEIRQYDDTTDRLQVLELWRNVFGYETAHNEPNLTISKKIVRLEESVSRLDRLIKEGIV